MADSPVGGFQLLTSGGAGGADRVNEFIYCSSRLHAGMTDRTNAPPAHVDGNAYLITASPTGDWAGKADHIAVSVGGAWVFVEPSEGMKVYVEDEDLDWIYTGSAWEGRRGRDAWNMHAYRSGSQTYSAFKFTDRFSDSYRTNLLHDGKITEIRWNAVHQNGSDPGDWTGTVYVDGASADTFTIPWNAASNNAELGADTSVSISFTQGQTFYVAASGPACNELNIALALEVVWTS